MGSSEELVKVIEEMRASVLQQSYTNSQGNEVPPFWLIVFPGSQTMLA